ncbi:MAG: long-chain fatty acid--CoA ligase [Acidobacteriota bacterium]
MLQECRCGIVKVLFLDFLKKFIICTKRRFGKGASPLKTLAEIPLKLQRDFGQKIVLISKRGEAWKGISSQEFCQKVEDLALKLLSLGVQQRDRIAILAENCPEWVITDHAIMSCGAITVPLHAVLPADQVHFILENSEATGLFLAGSRDVKKMKSILESLPRLRWIILFEDADPSAGYQSIEKAYQEGSSLGSSLYIELEKRRSAIDPDEIASIIYTSGTTGVPKGVMLSHRNFLSNVEDIIGLVNFGSEDVGLSLLPLSHVMERMASYVYLSRGATIAFATSYETLQSDFKEVRPTVAVVVPRILEVMQGKILSRIHASFFLKRVLFGWGLKIGTSRGRFLLEKMRPPFYLSMPYAIFSGLAFRKLHRSLGGRFRFFISGGAPLSPELGMFFFALGVPIYEGYGLTETSPVISINAPEALRFGTVGRILKRIKVRISEDGEILVRGPNVMKGYYGNEKATDEAFQEGWFKTGDTGYIEDGFLTIGERKKDIIVTSSGKNIAPQRIEGFLKNSPLINNVVVFGDSRSYISALIVPDFKRLGNEASRLGISLERSGRVINDEKLIDLFRKEIFNVTRSLASYEKIRKFILLGEEFTIDRGELTPTLKVRRNVIYDRYKDIIESMYERRSTLDGEE